MFMEVIKNFFSFFWKVMVMQEVLRSGFSFSQLNIGFVVSRKLRRNLFHSNDWNAILSMIVVSQPEIGCSKLTIETLEQDVKYVQS